MSLFNKKDKALSELRSVLSTSVSTPKTDLTDGVRERLSVLKTNTYTTPPPQEYGPRLWWVLHYEGEKVVVDDPYLTEGDAERKLADYNDGEVFMLRNITKRSDAKKAIIAILEARKLQQEQLQRGMIKEG